MRRRRCSGRGAMDCFFLAPWLGEGTAGKGLERGLPVRPDRPPGRGLSRRAGRAGMGSIGTRKPSRLSPCLRSQLGAARARGPPLLQRSPSPTAINPRVRPMPRRQSGTCRGRAPAPKEATRVEMIYAAAPTTTALPLPETPASPRPSPRPSPTRLTLPSSPASTRLLREKPTGLRRLIGPA